MAEYHPGDLVTFDLRDNLYGVAKILLIENLALSDNVHLAIYDRLVEGTEGGLDIYGDPEVRAHEFDGEIATSLLVSHLALTWEAFLASVPLKVGQQEVEAEELAGYQVWLHNRYENAVRQGLVRERDEDPLDEEILDEEDAESEEEPETDEPEEENPDLSDTTHDAAGESASGDADEVTDAAEPKGAWAVLSLEDVPVGQWLFQQHDNMRDAPFLAGSTLGKYILSHYDDSNVEEIEELVAGFIAGDYASGHELLEFGDTAANALGRELDATDSVELAEDILRILSDMGNDRAYEHIANYLDRHPALGSDPLALPAARAYLYVVMLTGGDPAPLRPGLGSIETMKHPELAEDRMNALAAVAERKKEEG